ncbi:MAG TPA: pilin [Candidatus Kapabacteria bacterium]|nr:pilin [Candidatus Kapabacteria bacterium]
MEGFYKKGMVFLFLLSLCTPLPILATTGETTADDVATTSVGEIIPESSDPEQEDMETLYPEEFSDEIVLSDEHPVNIVTRLINLSLSFLGIIFLIMVLYSGWLWLFSGGNEEKVKAAKKTFFNALIGLLIILVSNSVVHFIFSVLSNATGSGTVPSQTDPLL